MVFTIMDYEPHHYGAVERIGAKLFDDQVTFRSALLELTRHSKIVCLRRKVVGFAIVRPTDRQGIEIAYIGIDPEFQNRGIGSWLLDTITSMNTTQPFWLEVAYSNPGAQRLYARHGFRVWRRVGDKTTGGVIMRRGGRSALP